MEKRLGVLMDHSATPWTVGADTRPTSRQQWHAAASPAQMSEALMDKTKDA
jgi:hypothetical protein